MITHTCICGSTKSIGQFLLVVVIVVVSNITQQKRSEGQYNRSVCHRQFDRVEGDSINMSHCGMPLADLVLERRSWHQFRYEFH